MKSRCFWCATGVVLLTSLAAIAAPQRETLSVTTGSTSTDLKAATNTIRGYVEEVVFDVPATAGTTGNVSLVTLSNIATEGSQTIASKSDVSSDTFARPRVKSDATALGTQGTEYMNRLLLVGEQVVFSVTNATITGGVWRCHIKFDDGK